MASNSTYHDGVYSHYWNAFSVFRGKSMPVFPSGFVNTTQIMRKMCYVYKTPRCVTLIKHVLPFHLVLFWRIISTLPLYGEIQTDMWQQISQWSWRSTKKCNMLRNNTFVPFIWYHTDVLRERERERERVRERTREREEGEREYRDTKGEGER